MILQSKNVWYEETFKPLQIVVKDDKIIQIVPYEFYNKNVIDMKDDWILPGFIDIHCHGYAGCNVNFATFEGLKKWNEMLPTEGVTSYLLTSSTAPWDMLLESYSILNEFISSEHLYSEPLGIHIEGPFISKDYKGAHNIESIQELKIESLYQLMALAPNKIKMIALACENDKDNKFTEFCTKNDIVVALGHSGASFEEVSRARKSGAKNFTHTFNAMPSLHHRNPGVVGAAMYYDDMYAELIADGVHVRFEVAKILGMIKGKDKLITVTDSVSIKGLPRGKYVFPDRTVTIDEDGCGRLDDGRLAGSSNRMDKMLYNLIYNIQLPLVNCINSVTKNPANLLNIRDKGLIEVGYDADLVITSKKVEVLETYKKGKKVYSKL